MYGPRPRCTNLIPEPHAVFPAPCTLDLSPFTEKERDPRYRAGPAAASTDDYAFFVPQVLIPNSE